MKLVRYDTYVSINGQKYSFIPLVGLPYTIRLTAGNQVDSINYVLGKDKVSDSLTPLLIVK